MWRIFEYPSMLCDRNIKCFSDFQQVTKHLCFGRIKKRRIIIVSPTAISTDISSHRLYATAAVFKKKYWTLYEKQLQWSVLENYLKISKRKYSLTDTKHCFFLGCKSSFLGPPETCNLTNEVQTLHKLKIILGKLCKYIHMDTR